MFSHITVPVDGSSFSESAIPYATSIARRTEGRVELVIVEDSGFPPRVIEPVQDREAGGAGGTTNQAMVEPPAAAGIGAPEPVGELTSTGTVADTESGRRPIVAYVEDLAASVAERTGLSVSGTVLAGRPVDALVDHARETGTSIIVMATHGRGAFSRFWLGSVADEMARTSPVPLLLVRPREDGAQPEDDIAFREILVPLDGSTYGEEVLILAAPLAAAMDGRITLLRVAELRMLAGSPVAPNVIQIDDVGLEADRAQAEQYLAGVAARLRHRGFTVRVSVAEGSAAREILDYAESNDVDLIAMTTHGRGGLKRFMIGSVADKCLRGTDRPILLFRPEG